MHRQMNRQVQRLIYDGEHLYCPDHATQPLDQGIPGTIIFICNAPVPGVAPGQPAVCARSAEWSSEEEMNEELGQA